MTMNPVRNGFAAVRPYLHGPAQLPDFVEQVFDAQVLEHNEHGPTLLKIGADGAVWIEAGDLPPDIEPWTGSVYVYVADVDAVFQRAIARGATVIAPPEDKPYAERQCGFADTGGNTWWVSTYLGNQD
jgi:PhnB protein